MMLRLLALPAALVAALALAPAAEASPLVPTGMHAGGVRVGVGVGVGFPIGGSSTYTVPTGYWAYQQVPVTTPVNVTVQVPYQVTVQVPDRMVGYDAFGRPIWAYRTEVQTHYRTETRVEYQTTYVTQRVWVPTGYEVRRQPSGWGTVGVGFRFR
ncbi:MAG: hypothetical protein ACKOSS_05775 [Planctomycetia bacterium]